jgi:hypothetical protein
VSLAGPLGAVVADGPFSVEGTATFWLPGLFTALWYLGASVALLRMKGPKPAFEVERSRTG